MMKVIQFPMTHEVFTAVANACGVNLGGDFISYAFEVTVSVAGKPSRQIWTHRGHTVAILIEE